LIEEGSLLETRFSELLRWERIKRREAILVAVFFYAVLVSLIVLPVKELLPLWVSPLSLLLLLFLILAPVYFLMRPWGNRESVRTVFLLDKALHLEERAITAWEILGRKEEKAAEQLVLKEAGEKLRGVDPRLLLKRRLPWHAYLVPPLFLLWLLLLWFDIGFRFEKGVKENQPISTAQKLKEFAHEIQGRLESEQLTESLKAARALEEVAEKSLKGEMGEKEMTERLSEMASEAWRLGPEPRGDRRFPTITRDGLVDLKAELETMRHFFSKSDSANQENKLGAEMLGMLGAFSRLKEEMERRLHSTTNLNREGLNKFFDRLEKDVQRELDRRTLREITEFLNLLLQGEEGKSGPKTVWETGRAGEDRKPHEGQVKGKGVLPGDRPGAKGRSSQPPSPAEANVATHLKGLLNEGESSGVIFRGEAKGRKSEVSQDEVFTSYQRQAEEELAAEKIPDGLKETIKRYFLSLGMTEDKKGE